MSDPAPQSGCTLEDLRRTVEVTQARMLAKLDAIADHLKRTDSDVEELKSRVASAEQKLWKFSGAAATLGVTIPYVIQAVGR